MGIKTVGELREFLQSQQWSCETLASHVPVSNMTWRRLLALPDQAELPEKYCAHLNALIGAKSGTHPASLGAIDPVNVVLSGMQQTRAEVLASLTADGEAIQAPEKVVASATRRLRDFAVPRRLASMIHDVRGVFPSLGRSGKLMVLGSLAYFLNPFDLIADSVVTVGFIDDIGVLTLIHNRLFTSKVKKT